MLVGDLTLYFGLFIGRERPTVMQIQVTDTPDPIPQTEGAHSNCDPAAEFGQIGRVN